MPSFELPSRTLCCAVTSGFLFLFLPPPALAQGPAAGADRAAWMKANGCYDAANHLLKAKNYKDAIAKYKEAIALYPDDASYHYNLALALKHAGSGPEAVSEFKRSLELNGKDWKCWKALGNTQYRLGQFADARGSFESALKLAPPRETGELRAGIAACSARAPQH